MATRDNERLSSSAPPAAVSDCLATIERQIDGDVRGDLYSRVLYSTDASIYRVMPLGVVLPRTTDDVQAIVETAVEYGVPILPRASGSSLAGQAVNEALIVDMTRHLDTVIEVDAEARRVRVEPGVVLDRLNAELQRYGLAFGPDPASSDRAAIGGIVGNNSTGTHSILYGMTADHVDSMRVVLGDGSRASLGPVENGDLRQRLGLPGLEGEIYSGIQELLSDDRHRETIRDGTPRHWRRSGGYNLDRLTVDGSSFQLTPDRRFNLAKLVCGSEGSLAVMTEVTLNLVPLPRRRGLALLHFGSLREALSAVPVVLEACPSAVELLDHLGITMCRESREYSRLLSSFLEGDPNCVLICEFQGESTEEVEAGIDELRQMARSEHLGVEALVPILDPAGQRDVWTVRKVALGLLMSMRGDLKPLPFVEDAAVPVEHLADYVAEVERFCGDLGTRVAYYAHASAGCLHIRPLIDAKQASEVAKMPEIQAFSVELLHGYGGVLSSEHGDGRSRSWLNERFFGPDLYRLYRQVKGIFDPHGLLNPGIVVDAGPMTENLRYGESYAAVAGTARFDFGDEQGFARAVEMCNGAGVCRRREVGTMCPSFMATREEEHSTRGRANALRAALSGALPIDELTSRRMYEVMELCVECKACKSECPSSVDMTKIKTEFLARYHERHGVPLRTRLFAHIARMSRLSSGGPAALVNTVLANGLTRKLLETTLGIDRRRRLPEFAREPFTAWFARREQPESSPLGPVVLFNDTLNTYSTPQVAIAATEVLQAAGHEVRLPGHGCCGRPMISKGLVEEARAAAAETIERLAPHAKAGTPIVGLEPSCVSALRDDYLYLLPNDPRVESVAAAVVSFEEHLAGLAAEGLLALDVDRASRRVLFHGHCHQKALLGTAPSRAVLEIVADDVVEVDSGCCGMAGSFGYEREHYDLSLAMAEDRLLLAVRMEPSDTLLVAAGASCREQLEHATGRQALHPAQVVRDAMRPVDG
jgi:FAD/FMN-containing dehydrogenase/Fe-S oxidoreductase